MRYSTASLGRIFIVRLEDGDVLHEEIEGLARQEGISAAALIALGGADSGSRLVVGPKEGRAERILPMETILEDVHEVVGVGTLFPDETGKPILHMHTACGRQTDTITGCVRRGVKVWHILEVVIFELTGTGATRRLDEKLGFKLLSP